MAALPSDVIALYRGNQGKVNLNIEKMFEKQQFIEYTISQSVLQELSETKDGILSSMKRISLSEIERKLHTESYEQICVYIYEQIKTGGLKPVKASGTNGKKPALYQQYWIADTDDDCRSNERLYSEYLYEEELNYKMSTHISSRSEERRVGKECVCKGMGAAAESVFCRFKGEGAGSGFEKRAELSDLGTGKIFTAGAGKEDIKALRGAGFQSAFL